jgi:hypothetical protein
MSSRSVSVWTGITLSLLAVLLIVEPASAATLTVRNNCGYTVYPGIYPPVYQNGGWSQAAGASVSFTINNDFTPRSARPVRAAALGSSAPAPPASRTRRSSRSTSMPPVPTGTT